MVISASRATDIPAFYGTWFMERLREGYCIRENPFNILQKQYVSFEKCKVIVFWTKNPAPFLPYLQEIRDMGYQYYFHYTLNTYAAEHLEPHLPPLSQRIASFQQLSARIGAERLIWRYDPIIMGNTLSVATHVERIDALGRVLAPYTEKLVFSFLDMYAKAARALAKVDTSFCAPDADERLALASGIAKSNARWAHPLRLATCAESHDLSALGIHKNACIDVDLLLRLCPHDSEMEQHYTACKHPKQGMLLPLPCRQHRPKDTGQRAACGCADSKDIGKYATCRHGCVYCYAQ
ncbi:MAG: DUF1848 domain-containing protein [Desulfovibrionaceae bacterium]